MADEKTKTLVTEIAETLGETDDSAIRKIAQLVKIMGEDFTKSLLDESLQIETNGGMMTNDKSRRRTLGGVFFYLAKGKLDKETRLKIFPMYQKQQKKKDSQTKPVEQDTPENSPE